MLDFFEKCKSSKPLYNKGHRASSQRNPVFCGSGGCHRPELLYPIGFPIHQSGFAQHLSDLGVIFDRNDDGLGATSEIGFS